MQKELPTGVKIARIANFIAIVLNITIALLMLAIAIPNFIRAAQDAGRTPSPIVLIVAGLIMLVIFCIPSILLIVLNRALWQLKKNARVWQIVVSALMLLAFPFGTILGAVGLYFMIFDENVKKAFVSE